MMEKWIFKRIALFQGSIIPLSLQLGVNTVFLLADLTVAILDTNEMV